MRCDLCGSSFKLGDDAQATAETLLCPQCAARVKEKAEETERKAFWAWYDAEDAKHANDPATNIPADGIVRAELVKGPNYKPRDMTVMSDDPHAPDLGGEGG